MDFEIACGEIQILIIYMDHIVLHYSVAHGLYFISTQILGRPDSQFYGWRILFAVPLLFALFQGVTLPWCPESPRFLFIKRKDEKATIKGRFT